MMPTIFVLMPYAKMFRATYRDAIKPAIEESGLQADLAEEQLTPGLINKQIIESIKLSKLCIADLSGANPNVMYEVAYAHSLGKPVIMISRGDLRDIPFDIRNHRTLKYQPDDHDALKADLIASIETVTKSERVPAELLRRILSPSSLGIDKGSFVVAANPLSYRAAFRSRGGSKKRPLITYSDYVGVRGLMQSFGLMYGLDRFPELINPDDFDDKVLEDPMNLYAIGSPKANRWTGIMMARFFEKREPRWEFKPDPDSKDLLNPRVIIRRDKEQFTPDNYKRVNILKWDFGLVIRGPHPVDSSFMFTALAGRGSLGTEATCLAVTDPLCLQLLSKKLEFEKVDLEDHRQAFCAIVSIGSSNLRTNKAEFAVQNVIKY